VNCSSIAPVGLPAVPCDLTWGHAGLHRTNMLIWHEPPLLLVGGEPPDLERDTDHWIDGQVVLSGSGDTA
jgi:hypothetical protein